MSKPEQDNWRGSWEYWAKLAEIYKARLRKNRRSYIYVPLAEALCALGETEEAMETLEDGLALAPDSRAAMIMLARLRREKGDRDGAKSLLTEVISRWPDALAAVETLCGIYEEEGDAARALALAEGLRDYFPDTKEVGELISRYERILEREDARAVRDGEGSAGPLEMELSIGPGMIGQLEGEAAQAAKDNGAMEKSRQDKLYRLERMLDRVLRLKEMNSVN